MLHSLPSHLRDALESPIFNGGTTREALDAAAAKLGVIFPDDYIALMLETNGAEFFLGESCLILHPVEELSEWNQPDDAFPAHLKFFGTNGASEKFAFDTRSRPHQIVVVPHYLPSKDDAITQGTSLHAFLERALRNEIFDEA